MTTALPFTESSVKRAVTAARKAGLDVSAVEIAPDGTITVFNALERSPPARQNRKDRWASA